VHNEMGGAGAAQGLSWSWELDFAALLECLTEPGPHDPPGSRLVLQRHLGECIAASPVVARPGLVLASPSPV
jgi:hypothetical protein